MLSPRKQYLGCCTGVSLITQGSLPFLAINANLSCVLLTVISRRRASIIPSIMYKLFVNPPAHKGPKMVARPPTERLTPWLNPLGGASQKNKVYYYYFVVVVVVVFVFTIRQNNKLCNNFHDICWGKTVKLRADLVFSLQWLWRRGTPETRPQREAQAAAETLQWWRSTAPIHNHLAGMES